MASGRVNERWLVEDLGPDGKGPRSSEDHKGKDKGGPTQAGANRTRGAHVAFAYYVNPWAPWW
eukprot:4433840-Alexandrium_andersonii.AAC.1